MATVVTLPAWKAILTPIILNSENCVLTNPILQTCVGPWLVVGPDSQCDRADDKCHTLLGGVGLDHHHILNTAM